MDKVVRTSGKIDAIIEIKSVTKRFDEKTTAVDDVSLVIKRGEFVTLLGPSGCGKTTLLRMIAGFDTPTEGKIFIEKQDVTDIPPNKRNINTVFQKYALFPHLNVFSNVAFGLKLKRIPTEGGKPRKLTREEIRQKVERGLKMVGLEDYEERDVTSLSGGQQQRVAIARALVCEPQVLLLDEPLGALDLKMRKEMQVELMNMHKNLGITFVYVTHDQEEALTMSDTVVVMRDGVIQQVGSPKKIYDEPINAFVADFIGESNIISGVMLDDFKIKFCDTVFDCEDKGFATNERVDIVVRPEDIYVLDESNDSGMLKGVVSSSVFKGTYYEMNIAATDYEFTVQDTTERKVGERVTLYIKPHDIHIMKRQRTENKYVTEVVSEGFVRICGGKFACDTTGFEVGQAVIATFGFGAVNLTDYEEEGVIGGNIAVSLYKGNYYQVQVYTDDDNDILLDTPIDWDIDDRVGINIDPSSIKLAPVVEESDPPSEAEGGEISQEEQKQ